MMKRLVIACLLICSCQKSPPANDLVGIQIQDRNGLSETISIPEKLETYNNIDFLSSQPFKKVIRVYKKEGKNHSIITTYHPNGVIWQYLECQDMRASGVYQEWFSTGQLKIKAYVIGGTADVALGAQSDWLFDGLSEVWDEQGQLTAHIPYEKGVLEGTSLNFYPNGQIERSVPYEKQLIEGELIEYFPDGQIKERTSYKKGLKQGTCIGLGEEGNVLWEEEYNKDLLQKGVYFSPKGTQISEVQQGCGFQTFFKDSGAFQQIEIQKGRQEGIIKQFSEEGKLQLIYRIKGHRKDGEEIVYYPSSEKKISLEWHDDMIHGSVKTWYQNGGLESQKQFARNKKNGTVCSWYEDGQLMLIEEYENDTLLEGQYFKKNKPDPISTVVQGNGVASLYDGQGIFLRKVIYHKGKPVDPEN